MKTLLVPVDFTATTDNAVNFAAAWCKRYGYERIVLLKTFYDSVFENVAVSAEYAYFDQACLNTQRDKGVAQLQQLCQELAAKTGPGVKVMTATSEMPLLRAVIELIDQEKPELVILGSDNYSYSSGSYVASHVINIAKASTVRVLIVPASASYQPVTEALVPCDLNALINVERINHLRTAPQWHDIQLQVLIVDPAERHLNPDATFLDREQSLHDYLKNFQHQLHYRNEKNVITGIKHFIAGHDVQLIIALPGKHSFLYNLTHSSISEAIYRNASKPVLVLK